MSAAKPDSAEAARLVGYIGGTARRDLHGVEMSAITKAVDVADERLVDLHQHARFFELPGAAGSNPVEARPHIEYQ